MSLQPKVNILLVDDYPENLLALEGVLENLGQNLVRATSGAEALRHLLNQDFAVILLDVQMPEMDGFETATLIRQRERSRYTPIIFLTAFSSSDQMVFKGYSIGAVDYLFKPIDGEILKSKVAAFVELYQKSDQVQHQASQLAAMNAELQQREEMFRSLSVCCPVGIFLTNTNGVCTYTNPRWQAIYGMTYEQSLGDGWSQALHPLDREKVIADWYAVSTVGKDYRGEFRLLLSGGVERWVYAAASPMLGDSGDVTGYVGTVEDITERKQAQEERIQLIAEQAARQEAENANRLKDEFLATLSHELRTPLTSILGWAKLLRQRKLDELAIARALETIERNASVQAQLIEDILDVSRIMRGKLYLNLSPLNLVNIVTTAVENFRLEAEAKNLQLKTFISPPGTFLVSGDTKRLQQVMWNLLSNAVKFTPNGGNIQVRLSAREDQAEIYVIDTGSGISPEFMPHVFERFRQADGSMTRHHGGLGLGLAIARYLVEMHQGSIKAESQGTGQGATFIVKIPLLQSLDNINYQSGIDHILNSRQSSPPSQTNNHHTSEKVPEELLLQGLRVLVVDDDIDTRNFILTALQKSGAEVTAVDSSDSAFTVMQQLIPDVLVSDIGMPGQDGYSLIRQIRNLTPEQGGIIPAIALTGYVREEDINQALAAGFQMYIPKPVEPSILINSVAQLANSLCHSPDNSHTS
ncbi:hybrid sensor histidine kinase/response regulator [Calothrix sp. 336/3]|uniref:hybrid sensor histidine kinase/response regulator n=1 Tax=Calothrix sp. 336/3 TaxID=1337936 RepID=UPI0004E345CD|nr:response regulator [Calothrix sp. 336/3]AKG23954.1 chemotaxis protein CheY [Calothrix sp. 336/3]